MRDWYVLMDDGKVYALGRCRDLDDASHKAEKMATSTRLAGCAKFPIWIMDCVAAKTLKESLWAVQ